MKPSNMRLSKMGGKLPTTLFSCGLATPIFYIDLAAEPLIAATKSGPPIAVEIKSFLSESPVTEFHNAWGKFINYRLVLAQKEPQYTLYLAVPLDTYNTFFQRQFTQLVIQQYSIKLIVYNTITQEIVTWIN